MRIQPKRIMCAIDFSEFTREILDYSIAFCKTFHAKLFLVHIVDDANASLIYSEVVIAKERLIEEHTSNARNLLLDLISGVKVETEIVISFGDPADEISKLALREKIDVVISATHGQSGIKRFLIGSVTEKLIKTLHCPVLVLRTENKERLPADIDNLKLKKIMVGCDFSPDSKHAFDYGLSLAQEFQADLYLVHVIKPTEHIELKASDYIKVFPGDYVQWVTTDYYEMQQKVTEENREKIEKLRSNLTKQLLYMLPEESQAWCTPHTILLSGEPYKELVSFAKGQEVDIIVLGIRGHTLWEKLMVGSTTDRVIRHTHCPVLAVRQTDAEKSILPGTVNTEETLL